MKQTLLLITLSVVFLLAACGPSNVETDPTEPALQPADSEPDVIPRATITATAVPDGYPAAPTQVPLPEGYAMPEALPAYDPYPGIDPAGENEAWMIIPSGEQCAESITYPTEQDAVAALEAAGVEVLESKTMEMMVTTACGSPTSTHYLVLIDQAKMQDAMTLGWTFAE